MAGAEVAGLRLAELRAEAPELAEALARDLHRRRPAGPALRTARMHRARYVCGWCTERRRNPRGAG